MKIIKTPAAFARWRQKIPAKTSVGFVPTMGALHEGHLSLIEKSNRENRLTVVSIFVNPTQFGPREDFNRYPRPWVEDIRKLKKKNVAALFYPAPESMYPKDFSTEVFVSGLSKTLCGSIHSRGPGHFKGVATVVTKLMNIVRPTRTYFGLKDFQQVRVIEQLNEDLNLGFKIIRCPTVREPDGLAMSSRNAYLTSAERRYAPQLYQTLLYGRKLLTSHPSKSPDQVQKILKNRLSSIPDVKIDYVELVHPRSLQKVEKNRRPILIAAAVKFKSARLIDNILVK